MGIRGRRTGRQALAGAGMALVVASQAWAGRVIDLGVFGGSTGILAEDSTSAATGISANGIVVGSAWGNGHIDAFVYSGGQTRNVGALGVFNQTGDSGQQSTGVYTYARAVNSAGYVTGAASQTDQFQAYESVNGSISRMGVVPYGNGIGSGGTAINEKGSVAGWTGTALPGGPFWGGYKTTGFVYVAGTMYNFLAPGSYYTMANGLNNNDLVVGTYGYDWRDPSYEIASSYYAFSFDPHTQALTTLGTLGGRYSSAAAVNDAGQIVGTAADANGIPHAFLYSGNQMVSINPAFSSAYGISQDGHVVGSGYQSTSFVPGTAFVYYQGILTDLNSLLPSNSGWDLIAAYGVNDAGQIVGQGYFNGQYHAFLMEDAFLPGQAASATSIGVSIVHTASQVPSFSGLGGDAVPPSAGAAPEPGTWALFLGAGAVLAQRRTRAGRGRV